MRGLPGRSADRGSAAMSAATGVAGPGRDGRVPWADVVMSAVAAVSWALIGMAGTAALGLHLLDADTAGSLAPMAAAVVALAVGGSVTPTGTCRCSGCPGPRRRRRSTWCRWA